MLAGRLCDVAAPSHDVAKSRNAYLGHYLAPREAPAETPQGRGDAWGGQIAESLARAEETRREEIELRRQELALLKEQRSSGGDKHSRDPG